MMSGVRFIGFDMRGYPTVDVRTGYGSWASSYESTVEDVMDVALLDRLGQPRWDRTKRALDLGCGTGRTGAWLRSRGVAAVDGLDLTPEMLELARARGAHDQLLEGDATATGLPENTYDMVIASLIDEHLDELAPLYREAWRVSTDLAYWVLVAFHPHFIMHAGMPTHFTGGDGEQVAITTNVHLISDHIAAGLETGWELVEMREGVVDEEWLAVKPKWRKFAGHPVSAAFVWRKAPPDRWP